MTNPDSTLAAYDMEVLFDVMSADGRASDCQSASVPYTRAGPTVPVAPTRIGCDMAR